MAHPPHPPICDYEGSDYQSSFWEKGERAYEDRVEAIALRRLLPRSGNVLLEVGAGAGRNTPRYGSFKRVVLLDYALSQLQQARERLGNEARYIFVAANAYNLPFVPGLFDAVTMIRTLHHMAEASLAIEQVRKVLQPEGIFILEFANKQNIKAILRYLLGRQDWSPFSPEPIEFAELNFDFHPGTIRRWLKENDFKIERQLTVSHYRMGVIKRIIPLSLLATMDTIASFTGDWWQLSPSVFVRARALGNSPMAAEGSFFCCPACGQYPLKETFARLDCPSCSREWVIRDGIYDFRV